VQVARLRNVAPSGSAASCGAPIIPRVASTSGACNESTEDVAHSSSRSSTFSTPSLAASSMERYGS
jgi:hypothetical protein